jgi:hypothetical protein
MEISDNTWGIIELMGHRVRAGRISEVEIAGAKMLRVDVLTAKAAATDPDDFVTEYYGPTAIYSICPYTEEIVREKCTPKRLPARPLRFDDPPALAAPDADDMPF